MKRHLLIASLLVAAASLQGAGPKAEDSIGPAAFARLKTLAGDWQAETPAGKVQVRYELIAGGSALVERESGEKMPAMMTVYHLDGSRLLLTHYCAAGNQPRMQATSFNSATGELRFQFLDATNLASRGAGHMHNAKFRLIDHDHFNAEWEFYENGERKLAEDFQYTRVK
jgi:hypothetical protein